MFDVKQYQEEGLTTLSDDRTITAIAELKEIFFNQYYDPELEPLIARKKISHFANSTELRTFFISLVPNLRELISLPIFCGPTVTHFTSADSIGNNFGLGWHQDYPSMASSKNSIITWVSLTPCTDNTHGLEYLPNAHRSGLLKGTNTQKGYELNEGFEKEFSTKKISLPDGGVAFFSSFTPHRTFVHESFRGIKISVSQRFDDLNDPSWSKKGFRCAYFNGVNREMYKDEHL